MSEPSMYGFWSARCTTEAHHHPAAAPCRSCCYVCNEGCGCECGCAAAVGGVTGEGSDA